MLNFKVKDSDGKEYTVIAIEPEFGIPDASEDEGNYMDATYLMVNADNKLVRRNARRFWDEKWTFAGFLE